VPVSRSLQEDTIYERFESRSPGISCKNREWVTGERSSIRRMSSRCSISLGDIRLLEWAISI
jgi:hypothetical protein